MRFSAVLLFGAICVLNAEQPGRWQMQYFHDEENSSLTIADLKFPSPRRGIAVGYLVEKNSVKPMSVITSDGGTHWTLLPLKEQGVSLFFLNDSLGWMITTKGIWRSEESGRSWRKLKSLAGLRRIYFLDPNRGWAVGSRKQIYETADGGSEWKKLPAAGEPKSNPDYTQYASIDFANPQVGLIAGWSKAPRRGDQRLPEWLDPETATARRAWPGVAILIETKDGGKTWTPSTSSLFGQITKVRLSPDGWGVGLIEFFESFDWPSDVFLINWKTGANKRIFREKDRKVTDVAIASRTSVYLAAVEHAGKLNQLPIPKKVRILKTTDTEHWSEMEVDYRAVARRVTLAVADENHIWAGTDSGMILKLTSP